MSEKPKCPYFGDSTSPQLEIPADSTDSQIEAKARASVMRRIEAENRVLTFDEFVFEDIKKGERKNENA